MKDNFTYQPSKMLRQHAGLLIRDVRVQISVEGPIWDRNLKVKYRTFNPTKKGQYLPVSPFSETHFQSELTDINNQGEPLDLF